MKSRLTRKEMLPLVGMTVSAFIFNTSEFMPIGLLTDIAKSFSISESKAGMLITVYSWIVMLLSLPLILLVSKIDFRKLFMGTIALFGICQIMSVIAPTYGVLMASRIGVACTHAIFWSIASPVAIRLVNEEHRSFALSMVVTGTSIATIAGLPLGRLVGQYMGWRVTFLIVGIIAFAVLVYMAFVFPKIARAVPCEGSPCSSEESGAHLPVYSDDTVRAWILHGVQLYRAVHAAGCKAPEQCHHCSAPDIWSDGSSRKLSVLKAL